MNVNIFTPTLQQTVNPTVETWSSFSPRYTLSKDFQLRGRITAAFEWTNSDITTNKNEFRVGDAVVQLFYRGVPSFWNGTKVNPFASVGLPVSIESRARTMIVSPGVGFQVAHPFDNVLGGEVLLLGVASFSHPFYSYTTAGLREPPPYNRQCFGGADATCANQVSGAANPSNIFTWNVLATGSWGKFSPGVLLLVSHAAAYRFKELPGLERMEDRTSLRQSSYVAAWLDYELNSWLTPEIGYQHSRSALDADGTYGNPLFSRYQDMRVYLGANVQLDSLYKTLRGQTGEAGVVRAKNEKRPVLMF
jgi:hypothetical protein